MGDVASIKQNLEGHHDGKFGYVVYRCVYGDDAQWAEFMEPLDHYVESGIRWTQNELAGHFVWTVMNNEAAYKDATKEDVRSAFEAWVEALTAKKSMTKYLACIYVDQEVIDAVLDGEDPDSYDREVYENPRAYVKLVYVGARPEWAQEDDGYPSVEGCKAEILGWMKVAAASLVPRAYAMLKDDGWLVFHKRPPAIWSE